MRGSKHIVSSRLATAILGVYLLTGIAVGEEPDPSASYRDGLARCDSLHRAAQYDECVTAARDLLARAETEIGPSTLIVAEICDRIVSALIALDRWSDPESSTLARRSLSIKETLLPADSPSLAESVNLLGSICERLSDYAAARDLFARALAIREDALDPTDPELAESLISVANLSARLGEYEGLAGLYERALAIHENAYGPDHDKVAMTLQNFAIYRKLTGDYEEAERLYRRTLDIYERRLGPTHLRVARVHHNLGNLHQKAGDYRAAREDYEQALAIREAVLGPDHVQVGMTLVGLAAVLTQIGELVEAWDCAQRSVEIYTTTLGPAHHHAALAQGILAKILRYLGDTPRAAALLEETLAIQEEALGGEHPWVAEHLFELGRTREREGDLERAEAAFRRSLAIYEDAPDLSARDVIDDLRGLGRVLIGRGRTAEGRALLERAAALCEETFGPESPMLSTNLLELGEACLRAGDAVDASRLIERARRICQATLGEEHPQQARCLQLLSWSLAATGEPERALDTALAAEAIGRRNLQLLARGLPEQLVLLYAPARARGLDPALSILTETPLGRDPARIRSVWDAVIRSRALILDEMAARQRSLIAAEDEEIRARQKEHGDVVRELAWFQVAGLDAADPEDLGVRLDHLRSRQESIERELARRSEAAPLGASSLDVGLAEVIAALPDRSALVSYVRYERRRSAADPDPDRAGAADADTLRAYYAALVLPSRQSSPLLVPLGPAAEIDLAVSRWRDEAGHGIGIPDRPEAIAEEACRAAGDRIRRLVWDPLADRLNGAARVVIIPDETLYLIDFAALPAREGGFLVETDPLLSHVVSERDLTTSAPGKVADGGLLALGAPDFDVEGDGPAPAATSAARAAGAGLRAPDCDEFRRIRFASLPESAFEIEEIARIWTDAPARDAGRTARDRRVLVLSGHEASEDAFKRLAGRYRVLHLATHGFFLDSGCHPVAGTRGVAGVRPTFETATAAAGVTNPLLLSGFALAGANARRDAGPDREDGIVLAGEIAALDLHGVSWAVLSACETGLGAVQTDEGVLGLRRAFHVAGVPTLITSLWSVADETARLWMTEFYRGRLEAGLAADAAAREASRRLLAARRAAGQSTHPHHWAGFLVTGPGR
jgi:CHAT domain-containing protein/tetratricopeptide (TPR) repeat protein